MVKRQRRMTTRKKTGAKKSVPLNKTAKPTKVKKGLAKRSVRGPAKTDRSTQALKVLLKGLNKKEESE